MNLSKGRTMKKPGNAARMALTALAATLLAPAKAKAG